MLSASIIVISKKQLNYTKKKSINLLFLTKRLCHKTKKTGTTLLFLKEICVAPFLSHIYECSITVVRFAIYLATNTKIIAPIPTASHANKALDVNVRTIKANAVITNPTSAYGI